MSNNNSNTGLGIGSVLGIVLGIVFITLKLCGVINWSWWWVLAPIWIPWSIVIEIIVIYAIGSALFG